MRMSALRSFNISDRADVSPADRKETTTMQNSPFPIGNDGLSQTGGKPILWSSAPGSPVPRAFSARFQRVFYAPNKVILVKGLCQVPERSGFQHARANIFIVKGSHENHRGEITLGNQLCLKVGTAHAWHLNIGN
jgi:hypothetical protein